MPADDRMALSAEHDVAIEQALRDERRDGPRYVEAVREARMLRERAVDQLLDTPTAGCPRPRRSRDPDRRPGP
jgi:hypothetical protein